ncbi:response regulator transcription factor [Paenibacillus antri]|uniref:Response regulator transcription factor n=2 Tax=Paenibacillus antri TaxID=2582848 RepID=A0A5R9G4W4_9BACL|nr:response regulator transcription factor [Paenibacillus antri]
MRKRKILIAEDHPVFRDGLVGLLKSLPEFELVGEAQTGEEAIQLADAERPDLILMDINMPGINGIEASREIIAKHPRTGILILTMFDDDHSVFAAMRSGARGYLLKDASQQEIVRAIVAVGEGEAIFSSAIARRMMYYFDTMNKKPGADVFPELTAREREILDWIARGGNNAEIAKQLGIASKTMRNYVSNILSKLHAADRAHAIVMAREAGLGKRDPS